VRELQLEHKLWLADMYPNQPSWLPACGMVEEANELLQACIRLEQEARWGKELRYSDRNWMAAALDAVGDCGIYACSLANACGWRFDHLMEGLVAAPRDNELRDTVLHLVRVALSIVPEPHSHLLTKQYLRLLQRISAELGVSFAGQLKLTWQQVRQRTRSIQAS
jgi:hypothetical protein